MTSFVVQGHILYNNTFIQNILNGYIIIPLYPYTKIDHESTFLDGRNKKDNFLKPIRGHFNISNVTRFTFKKQHFFFFFQFCCRKCHQFQNIPWCLTSLHVGTWLSRNLRKYNLKHSHRDNTLSTQYIKYFPLYWQCNTVTMLHLNRYCNSNHINVHAVMS